MMFRVADLYLSTSLNIQAFGCPAGLTHHELSSQFLVLILLNSRAVSYFPLLTVRR